MGGNRRPGNTECSFPTADFRSSPSTLMRPVTMPTSHTKEQPSTQRQTPTTKETLTVVSKEALTPPSKVTLTTVSKATLTTLSKATLTTLSKATLTMLRAAPSEPHSHNRHRPHMPLLRNKEILIIDPC